MPNPVVDNTEKTMSASINFSDSLVGYIPRIPEDFFIPTVPPLPWFIIKNLGEFVIDKAEDYISDKFEKQPYKTD